MIGALLLFAFAAATPEQRAVEFLSREVPRWSRENNCFSCHNNGDGARVLYMARSMGYSVPREALEDTAGWLREPEKWDRAHGFAGVNDSTLARIQFAAALAESRQGGGALTQALEMLAASQDSTGSWAVDTSGIPGAPVTYGTVLATYMARRTLEGAGGGKLAGRVSAANSWLEAAEPGNILDASALLLALPRSEIVRRRCLERVLQAQTSEGGWGPQARTPAEAFDTAIALLALEELREPQRTSRAIARGRGFLIRTQLPSGAWPETTRPRGQQSYAEYISTSAWALEALLRTNAKGK